MAIFNNLEELKTKCVLSVALWFAACARIYDKTKALVPVHPNIYQIRLCQAVEWALAQKVPVRIIGLKPSQVGGTTIAAAVIYWLAQKIPMNIVLIADIYGRSQKLFAIFKTFAEADMMDWSNPYTSTDKIIKFKNGSVVEMKTAENQNASRASTLQGTLISELPFWPHDAEETITAVERSLATHPNTIEIIESTPKGAQGIFPKKFREAKWPEYDKYWQKYGGKMQDGEGESIFIRVFAAWFEFPEHKREVSDLQREAIYGSLNEREKKGVELYRWTAQQIAWRRFIISNQCQGSEVKFDEEYPEDPEKCFLASGRPRFDVQGMNYLQSLASATAWKKGQLTDPKENHSYPSFIPTGDNESWFWMCEEPKVGLRYLISCDVASDRDVSPKGATDSNPDRHVPMVLRAAYTDQNGVFHRKKQVARLSSPCTLGHDKLAYQIHMVSRFYGNCVIAVEMNNHGLNLFTRLKDRGANLLMRKVIDPKTSRETEVYGWTTTTQSRQAILEELSIAVREADMPESPDGIEVTCHYTVAELLTFQIDKDGKAQAATGCHDDEVISLAIGNYLINSATKYAQAQSPSLRPRDNYRVAQNGVERRDTFMPAF